MKRFWYTSMLLAPLILLDYFFLTQKGMHSNFVNNLISVLMLLTPYDEIFICLSLPYRLSKVFKLEKGKYVF